MNFIGGILSTAIKGAAATAVIASGTAIARKVIFSPQKAPTEPHLDNEVTKQFIKKILNYKDDDTCKLQIDNLEREKLKNFLLKFGVHIKDDDIDDIKDNILTLSKDTVEKLQAIIKDPREHLATFGIDMNQMPFVLKDLAKRFDNFIKKNFSAKTSTALTDEDLINDRLAERITTLFNHSPSDNPLNPSTHIETLSHEKLLEPYIKKPADQNSDTPQQSTPVTDKTILTMILHAPIFGTNNKEKITYDEFTEKITLPAGVGISKSDFDAFQNDSKEIPPDLSNYKTILTKNDLNNKPPKDTKVIIEYDSNIFNKDTLNKEYIKDNAENIFIKVNNATELLVAYAKINNKNINFIHKDNKTTTGDTASFIKFIQENFKEDTSSHPLFKAIIAGNDDTQKDDLFKKIIEDKNIYDTYKDNYPQLMEHLYKKEMETYEKIGTFFTKTEKDDLFNKFTTGDVSGLQNREPKAKQYLFNEFIESENYTSLEKDKKITFLNNAKTHFTTDTDNQTRMLISKKLNELGELPQDDFAKTFNDTFDDYQKNDTSTFNTYNFLCEGMVKNKSDADKYNLCKAYIKANQLNQDIQPDSPQNIAKIIMKHQLHSFLSNLQKTAKANDVTGIDNFITNTEVDTGKITELNEKLQEYFGDEKFLSSDKTIQISQKQMKSLVNFV